ncbi:MAG TPA: amidohydrolase family protein [Desulfuromonadales bacterium]|nr:amidohydrolase family protein [Desulfuromonadales bacterium]
MTEATIYAASWLINPDAEPLPGGALLVRDGIIAAVGTVSELRSTWSAPVVEYPGCALLPGFVNAHTHLELTHYPAWRLHSGIDYHPHRFTDWIIQLIKIKRGLTADASPASLLEGGRMCLESGTTAIGEIVSNPALMPLYRTLPLAGRLYFELLGQDDGVFGGKRAAALEAVESLPAGPLQAGLSPHAPYTIAEKHLRTIAADADARTLPLSLHLSESPDESAFVFDSSGPLAEEFYPYVGWEKFLSAPRRCSSTELFDRHGLLSRRTLAVHCVHLTLADARIIKERRASIAICPRSNERLDVGRAPVALFKKLGIPLAIGTDSLASNDSLSLWDELRYALDAFPAVLSPAELLQMATTGGAAAIGRAEDLGSLEVGKRADFQVIEPGGASCTGKGGLIERIIQSGRIQDVYVGGFRFTINGEDAG